MTQSEADKRLDAIGKGMQAAGGHLSSGRAGASMLHAGASMLGLQDYTKNILDKSSQPNISLTDADLADLNEADKDMKL